MAHRTAGTLVALAFLACIVSRLGAQDRLPGFGANEGRPRLAGFGRDAALQAKVNEADRRSALATMAKHDLNRNGVLDRSEILKAKLSREVVRQHDRDRDGQLSLEEETFRWTKYRLDNELAKRLKARQAQPAAKPPPPAAPTRPIDPVETSRTNLCMSLATEIIGQRDRNGNKLLEMAEWKQASVYGELGRADKNGDRMITHPELTVWLRRQLPSLASARLAKPLRLFDLNDDGQIEMHEYADQWTAQALADFQALDRNDDGVISPEESHAPPISRRAIQFVNNDLKVINQNAELSTSIWIEDDIAIEDLDLIIAMTKQNDHQTRISLVGPDGQSVILFAGGWQPWVGTSLFENTLIDDEAAVIKATLPRPPFPRRLPTDALKGGQPGLRHFYGKSARGSWRLVVKNMDNGVGVLHHWSILVTPKLNRDADKGQQLP